MSKNDIDELRKTLDRVLIETALNTVHLKTIEQGFLELADHCLDEDQARNLKDHYLHTLIERSNGLSSQLGLYNPARASLAQFDFQSHLKKKLKELEK